MPLDTKHRSSIYNKLLDTLGEEDASMLMDQFPALEADELVTKQFLRAELALTRSDLRGEMADLRTDLKTDIADLRTELKTDIADLRTELKADIADLRTEMQAMSNRLMTWTVTTMLAGISVAVTLAYAVGRVTS